MSSITEQLFGNSGAPAASPSTGFGAPPAADTADARKARKAAGKHAKATRETKGAPVSAKPAGLAGFAAAGSSSPVDMEALFRKVAPPAEGAGKKATRREKARVEEAARPKHRSHAVDELDPNEVCRTVFISNLPNSMTIRPDLSKHFRECGEIENLRIRCLQLAKHTGEKQRGRGVRVLRGELLSDDRASAVGYILFKRPSSVDLALAMSGTVFKGRHLTVAREEQESKAFLPKFSVFLGNMIPDITDEDVWNYFLEKGVTDVDRVRIIRDRESGLSRGIGYVGFRSSASVKKAIDIREQDLKGRPLRICHVQKPKDPKLQITEATRREKRRLQHQKAIIEGGPSVLAGKKLTKKAKTAAARGSEDATKTSGRRVEAGSLGIDDVPAWMGATTNPRKKLPAELRALTQTSEDRKKAITEKRKANQERVREQRKDRNKRGGGGGGRDRGGKTE
jgi:nucleolar protein 12